MADSSNNISPELFKPKHCRKYLRDLTGQTFGRLTVIRFDAFRYVGKQIPGKRPNRKTYWLCRCHCGVEKSIEMCALVRGVTRSCGCYNRDRLKDPRPYRRIHGMCGSAEYHVWSTMIFRCTNPNAANFERYGGRGITICERWRKFANFYADMGSRPTGYQLDRINNDGPYSPENCRWVTPEINGINKRDTVWLTWNGKTLSVPEWSKQTGLSQSLIHKRRRRGWPVEQIFTLPKGAIINRA